MRHAWIALSLAVIALSPPAAPARAETSAYAREAVIGGPPELVWTLLTTEEGIRSWLAPQAQVDLRVGGLVRTHQDPKGRLGDDQTTVSRVLSLKPRKRFSFRLEKAPEGYPLANVLEGTWYDVALEALPGGRTRIRCEGNGLATGWASTMIRPAFNQGVDLVFGHLEKAVESRLERKKGK